MSQSTPPEHHSVSSNGSSTHMDVDVEHQQLSLSEEVPPSQPFPLAKVSLIGLILLVNNFSMFVIFPFLPFMVAGFFPDLEDRQLGYYAGYLASAFHLGALPSGLAWGSLADRIGRRPVLLFGTIGTLISTILFGLSRSYGLALFSRFLWGALNGNVGVAKTYLSEICDDKNQAKGFAVIGFAAGAGRLLGPIVGGFFSQPAKKYPEWFGEEGFFVQFEYLLPMIIGASLCLVIFVTSVFLLEETLDTVASRDANNAGESRGRLGIWQLFRDHLISITVTLFALISFGATMSEEIFSLWLVLQPNIGGFGFNSSQIGTVISICAPIQLTLQAVLFPFLVTKLGFKRVFQLGLFLAAIFIAVLPFTNVFPRNIPDQAWLGWTMLILVYSCFVTFRFFGFTSVFALINNSCRNSTRGTVNGIGQSLSSISRFVSPPIGGVMFAWSVSDSAPALINFHLVFWFLSFWFFGVVLLSRRLPDSINLKMIEQVSEHSEQLSSEENDDLTAQNERHNLLRRRSFSGNTTGSKEATIQQ